MLAGQVNFRSSLPRSENVLQPMLHPAAVPLLIDLHVLHLFPQSLSAASSN